jgi:hypothetical protein
MDKHQQELIRGDKEFRNKIVTMNSNLSVLHKNVQSIRNKQTEIDLMSKEYWCAMFYRTLVKEWPFKINSDRSV